MILLRTYISASSAILEKKDFNIVAAKWQMIKPIKKSYNNRIYWVLQPGWTDIVAEILCQQKM